MFRRTIYYMIRAETFLDSWPGISPSIDLERGLQHARHVGRNNYRRTVIYCARVNQTSLCRDARPTSGPDHDFLSSETENALATPLK